MPGRLSEDEQQDYNYENYPDKIVVVASIAAVHVCVSFTFLYAPRRPAAGGITVKEAAPRFWEVYYIL